MFKVKFDLPGGLTMDEWIEKNMQRNAHRGGAAGEGQSKITTVKQTKSSVKCFKDWCNSKGEEINLNTMSTQKFSNIPWDSYGTVRNATGQLYGLSSSISLGA